MDRNLAAFLAVAKTGNLTSAADMIGLAQPSLSKRLANLEETLGMQLFERHRRGMELTEAGKLFARRAERIEHEFLQAKEELQGLKGAGKTQIDVGAGPLFSLNYVAPAYLRLLEEMPGIQMNLLADTNNRTLPMLRNGALDIVLGVIEPSRIDSSIVTRKMTTVEHGVVLAADDPLSRRERLRPGDLAGRRWILYSDDPETERWLTGYLVRQGFPPPNVLVTTSSFSNGLDIVRRSSLSMIAPVQLQSLIAGSGLSVVPTDPPITRLPAGAHIRSSSLGYGAITRFVDLVAEALA